MQLPSPIGQNPSLPSPFVQSSLGSGGGSAVVLPANVPNSDSSVFVPTGNPVAVTQNVPCTVHFRLAFATAGNAGGMKFQLIHPGYTALSGFYYARFNSTGATTFVELLAQPGVSPLLISSALATFATAAGLGAFLDFYLTFIPTASGNVDIAFQPNTNTQLMTLLAGSYAEIANRQRTS